MRFSVWPNPGRAWQDVLAVVTHCEEAGWDGAYVADHFMPNDPQGAQPLDGPVLECWSVIAALGAVTSRLRLGSLVAGNLYRHPAVLANIAATVDHITGGRLVVGLGAGWQANEHAAYGIDLLATKERLDHFEEACAVIRSLLAEQRTTFAGEHYRITDAPCDPKPVQDRVPLLVGGRGERRTLRIAARYADGWNAWTTPEVFRHKSQVLDRHCAEVGRNPAEISRSTQALVHLSADASALEKVRAGASPMPQVVGTPAEMVDQLAGYAEAGVDEFIVPDWTMGSVQRTRDTLDLFWTEVAAKLR